MEWIEYENPESKSPNSIYKGVKLNDGSKFFYYLALSIGNIVLSRGMSYTSIKCQSANLEMANFF